MTTLYRGLEVYPKPKTRLDRTIAKFRGRNFKLENSSRPSKFIFRGKEVTYVAN